ncbi:isochorismatase family protein [Streptomyces sp. T1317-0309]|nr:isochorismatase family protein [Streptomyces sp. T1317-0309]
MDFQNGIVLSPPTRRPRRAGQGAIADVRTAGGTVGYVRWASPRTTGPRSPRPTRPSPASLREDDAPRDPATHIDERIAPEDGDIVVRKIRYGSGSPRTSTDSSATGTSHPVLAGISTSGVVLSTLIDAADRDIASSSCPTVWPTPTPRSTACWSRRCSVPGHIIDTTQLRALLSA